MQVYSISVIYAPDLTIHSPRRKILAIAAELSAPPSSPLVFRDLTLVASIFHHYEILAIAEADSIDYYNIWFKDKGLWDFIEDLLPPIQLKNSEITIEIEGGPGAKLTAHNLNDVIAML